VVSGENGKQRGIDVLDSREGDTDNAPDGRDDDLTGDRISDIPLSSQRHVRDIRTSGEKCRWILRELAINESAKLPPYRVHRARDEDNSIR
jgi:hypothetical protein